MGGVGKVVRDGVSGVSCRRVLAKGVKGGHKAEGVQGASGTCGGATLPGHGRRMRVSTRPGEKSSDQSRVTICCERSANPSGVGAIGERLGDAIRARDERTRAGCERGGARTDLVAEETSEEYGVKLARDDSGARYCVPSVVSQCGMRRSQTGMRSFHAGRRLVGTTPPPRRPGGEELARQVWICPLRVSVAVHDAV